MAAASTGCSSGMVYAWVGSGASGFITIEGLGPGTQVMCTSKSPLMAWRMYNVDPLVCLVENFSLLLVSQYCDGVLA